MPTLLLFPILPFLLEVGLVFWWVFVAAYLYSSGMSHSSLSVQLRYVPQLVPLCMATVQCIAWAGHKLLPFALRAIYSLQDCYRLLKAQYQLQS